MFAPTSLVMITAASALLSTASAFSGDGTFYGAGGNGASGACFIQPGSTGVGVTVAMNGAQFGGACGACVKITGNGVGSGGSGATPIFGPVYAVVDNECPECHYGDIDFGLSGDGRWTIFWDFVDCNEARSSGSNIPQPDGNAHWIHARALRGATSTDNKITAENTTTAGLWLHPGYMVTAEGIKLIDEVMAAGQQGGK